VVLRFGIGVKECFLRGYNFVGLGKVLDRLAFVNRVGFAVRKAGWDTEEALFSLVGRMGWSGCMWFHGIGGVVMSCGHLLLDIGIPFFLEDI